MQNLKYFTLEIAEEEIKYYKSSLNKKTEEFDEIFKRIDNNEQEMENMKIENTKLKEEINILNKKAKNLAN